MAQLSAAEIYAVARQAGFTPDAAVTWTAIALAESGGRTDAHAGRGEDSWGLWQVNIARGVRSNTWGDLTDPLTNARAAYEISRQGTNLQPWTVTHERHRGTGRDYRRHLDEARAAGVQVEAGGGAALPTSAPDGQEAAEGPDDTAVRAFLEAAQRQAGDTYIFGAEAELDDADPEAFDCSELVQWAAHQAGVEITDGSSAQYLALKQQDSLITVEQALRTPGALLFSFSSEPQPGGGRPSQAHVAISLGDGRTIEARGRKWGVGNWEANASRFDYAGVIPGLDAGTGPLAAVAATGTEAFDQIDAGLPPAQADGDSDGLLDSYELTLGTDPTLADTDADRLSDAFELLKAGSDPLLADSDADGESDELEYAMGTHAGATDEDGDTLPALLEKRLGTDPTKADTDLDGLGDAVEHASGTDPLKLDTDGDGITDGAMAALMD